MEGRSNGIAEQCYKHFFNCLAKFIGLKLFSKLFCETESVSFHDLTILDPTPTDFAIFDEAVFKNKTVNIVYLQLLRVFGSMWESIS